MVTAKVSVPDLHFSKHMSRNQVSKLPRGYRFGSAQLFMLNKILPIFYQFLLAEGTWHNMHGLPTNGKVITDADDAHR